MYIVAKYTTEWQFEWEMFARVANRPK
jgi:hypothetical protein